MIQIRMDKGRLKIGRYSLSNLAIAEALSAITFFILAFVLGWGGWKDLRTYYAWNSALTAYASNQTPVADLEVAMGNRPEFLPVHELRGKIAAETGDFDRAREEYNLVLKADPANEGALVGLGVLSVKQYDKTKQEAALAEAKTFYGLASANADAKVGLGHILLRQKDLEGAYKMFEAALVTDPPPGIDGMTDLYIGMGAIAVLRKNAVAAREATQRVLFLTPSWDRGYANVAHLIAQQMAETPALDRAKFSPLMRDWDEFGESLFVRYALNKDSRAYYKEALATLYDAFGCLALRSLEPGVAHGRLNYMYTLDSTTRRRTLNYIATLATVVYNSTLTTDERNAFLLDLTVVLDSAFVLHKDFTPREQAVLHQLQAARHIMQRSDLAAAEREADYAKEQYLKGSDEPHLLAMIERVTGVAIWMQRETETNPTARAEMGDKALKAFRASRAAEPDQADLDAWLRKIDNPDSSPEHK